MIKFLPTQKKSTPAFIEKHLKILRQFKTPPRHINSCPNGNTDIRLSRVKARYQNGWGIWVKAEKHEYAFPGVCVEAVDWEAVEGEERSGQFLFSRDSTAGKLSISYQITGNIGKNDLNIPLQGKIVFPEKQQLVPLYISPKQDDLVEKTKLIKIKILPGNGYSIGTNRQSTRDYMAIRDAEKKIECNLPANWPVKHGRQSKVPGR